MKQHRSFAERYIDALNELHSCEGNPSVEIIEELKQASQYLEEYSLLNITSVCDLLAKVSDEIDGEEIASISLVINEFAVLSHNAMETRLNTERMLTQETAS